VPLRAQTSRRMTGRERLELARAPYRLLGEFELRWLLRRGSLIDRFFATEEMERRAGRGAAEPMTASASSN
jgi:hypothetical protein